MERRVFSHRFRLRFLVFFVALNLPFLQLKAEEEEEEEEKESQMLFFIYRPQIHTWTLFLDQLREGAMVVHFEKGESCPSYLETFELRKTLRFLRDRGNLKAALLVSWADEPFPEKGSEDLPQTQQDLADERNRCLSKLLLEGGPLEMESFSMAVRPRWHQIIIGSDEAQIKGMAGDRGWDDKNEEKMASILKDKGAPSTSILFFLPRDPEIPLSTW